MKKMIAFALVLVMIAGFAACTPADSVKPTDSAPAASAKPAEPVASAEPAEPSGNEGPIKIGVITSLTGERALIGEHCKIAITLAKDEINAAGGVLGRQVEIFFEDDQGTEVGAVNAFNKIALDPEVVAVCGPMYSNMAFAMNGAIQKSEIPTMLSGSNPGICEQGNPWIFQIRTTDAVAAAAVVNCATDKLGKNKISILYDSDASGMGQQTVAVATLKEKGLEPVTLDAFNTGDKDFTAQIMRGKQAGVEAFLCYSTQVEAGILTKQIRELMGADFPLCGSTTYSSAVAMDLAGDASNGVYSVTDYVPSSPRVESQEFAAKFKEIAGFESDFGSACFYDQFNIVMEGIRRAGSTDRTAVRDAILTIQDFAAVSNIFSFKPNGEGGTMVLLVQVQDGVPVVLDTITVK